MRKNSATPNAHPNIPLPPGALGADNWHFPGLGEQQHRLFYGAERVVLNAQGERVAEVQNRGDQRADGSIDSWTNMEVRICTDDGLSSDQARRLVPLLIEAAAELDGWVRR